jgi:hypothetical protein
VKNIPTFFWSSNELQHLTLTELNNHSHQTFCSHLTDPIDNNPSISLTTTPLSSKPTQKPQPWPAHQPPPPANAPPQSAATPGPKTCSTTGPSSCSPREASSPASLPLSCLSNLAWDWERLGYFPTQSPWAL